MRENSQKDDSEYVEIPKVKPEEISKMISPLLLRFSEIKEGKIEIDTFEEIINIEKDRLRVFINALPESNTSIISTFLSFISVLIGFFIAQRRFDSSYLLVLVIASFLSIWGILVLEVFISSRLKKFFFIELFMELLPVTLAPTRGSYVTFLHSKEFDPLIETMKEHSGVIDYFEKIYSKSNVYPRIKSVQFLNLFHLFLFLPSMFSLVVSSLSQNLQETSTSLLAFFGYFLISSLILIILGNMNSKDMYRNHRNKIAVFYIMSCILSLIVLRVVSDVNLLTPTFAVLLFAFLYVIISNFLYYFVKSQNIKRLLVESYDTLNDILFLLKTSRAKPKLLRELNEYSLLVHKYFRSRMYNPLPPLFVYVREDIFELLELYPDFGYLVFIDEDFILLFIKFIKERLYKLPDEVSIS